MFPLGILQHHRLILVDFYDDSYFSFMYKLLYINHELQSITEYDNTFPGDNVDLLYLFGQNLKNNQNLEEYSEG